MNRRLNRIKTTLWALVGLWLAAAMARFAFGLGATTGMNAATPWGIWVGFDVLCGVALAAGGFIMLGVLHILGLERYRPLVRPAALTAFLGYLAVVVGLLHDLGLPWRIYHPLIYWQPRSVMFAVAICETIYLGVLALEFTPLVLEHPLFRGPRFQHLARLLKRITLPLIILGLILATMHQSLLGSLYLLTPYRLHPLWYSPMIPALFLISAVGLGLMTVVVEALVSAWLFRHRIRMDLLAGLARCASLVLIIYLVLRVVDLSGRDAFSRAEGWGYGLLFALEVALGAALPAALLAFPRVRTSRTGLALTGAMVITGTVLNRLNVSLIAFSRPAGLEYAPSWVEVTTTLGLLAGAALIYLFFCQHLRIFADQEHEQAPPLADDPEEQPLNPSRRYSLALCGGLVAAVIFLPGSGDGGPRPEPAPVAPPRTATALVPGATHARVKWKAANYGVTLLDTGENLKLPDLQPVLVINGDGRGRRTLFTHALHQVRNGGEKGCGTCHHQGLSPDGRHMSCSRCHQDMFEDRDTFDHTRHVQATDGNQGCSGCHPEGVRKTRQTAKDCRSCHQDWHATGTAVKPSDSRPAGIAPSYRRAMHGLCIECHAAKARQAPARLGKAFARCGACH